MPDNEFKNDHDALITLISEVRQIRMDIKDLRDGTSATISDHESRLRVLEETTLTKEDYHIPHQELVTQVQIVSRWMYMGIGALGVLQLVINYVSNHYGK